MKWDGGGYAEWTEKKDAFISVVFSWQLDSAYQRAVWLRSSGYRVQAGGPAVALNPGAISDVAEVGGTVDALPHHNPDATFTTRGCIRHCPFCAVPIIEGDLVELTDWEPRPIVCDNNLLAASEAHFDRVIDRLKPLSGIDFNQGLDSRLLTKRHAERLTELNLSTVRLAWDNTAYEHQFITAYKVLRDAGIPARMIRVYVLIGFDDTPEDALYRLETIRGLGSWPNPMRYQPLDTKRRNDYVSPSWTDAHLKKYMRYWSRLAWFGHIPFSEYSA